MMKKNLSLMGITSCHCGVLPKETTKKVNQIWYHCDWNEMNMIMLELVNINKWIGTIPVVNKFSFSFSKEKKYGVMGETGSGKTMLAKIMAGLESVDEGDVFFRGQRVKGPHEVLIPGHPKMAYLSQYFELPNNYVVKDYLDFENPATEEMADILKKLCHIEHLLDRKTHAMSGGEKQRVALAKKLLAQPDLLILDEPFAHLDSANRQRMKRIVDDYLTKYQSSCIFVTHDVADAFAWADEVLIIRNGKLAVSGQLRNLYLQPPDSYTASLLGACTWLSPQEIPFRLPEVLKPDQKLLLRPEFCIIDSGPDAIVGIIQSVSFNGSVHIVEVLIDHHFIISCISQVVPPCPGSSASIRFQSQYFWAL